MAAITTVRTSTQDDAQRELEAELLELELELERRGPLRPRPDWGPGEAGRWCRACVFCRVELGLLMNKGVVCRDCRYRVCKTCRVRNDRNTSWLCPTCNKRRAVKGVSGEWVCGNAKYPSQSQDRRDETGPSHLIVGRIIKSWNASNPSPDWATVKGSTELGADSSFPHQLECSYPYPDHSHCSSSTPSDPDMTSSLSSVFPASSSTVLQSGSSDDEEENSSDIPAFQSLAHTSPLPMKARRYSPNRDCVDHVLPNHEQFITDDRFHSGEIGRNFLNRDARSESDRDSGVPVNTTRHVDHAIHDGYSSSPASWRRELTRKPHFDDAFCRHSSDVAVSNRHYGDIRQSFSDDSSPTPVRYDQRDEKKRSVAEQDSTKTSMIGEELKKKLVLGHSNRKCSLTDDDPGALSAASVKGSSGDDGIDTEPLFKKVILKKRRVESRRVMHGGGEMSSRVRRSTRVTESLRVTEVSRRVVTSSSDLSHVESSPQQDLLYPYNLLESSRILQPDGDDYKLVFISSDSSSKEEEGSHDSDDDAADEDSSSTSSVGDGVTSGFDCDWDYFESSSVVRPILRDWTWNKGTGGESSDDQQQTFLRTSGFDSPPSMSTPYRKRLLYSTRCPTLDADDVKAAHVRREASSPASSSDGGSFLRRRRSPVTDCSALDDQVMGGSYVGVNVEGRTRPSPQDSQRGSRPPPPSMLYNPRQQRQYFTRGDSLRSSGERSLEEITFSDHFYYYGCSARGERGEELSNRPPGGEDIANIRTARSGSAHECRVDSESSDHVPAEATTTTTPLRRGSCESCGAVETPAAFTATVPVPVPVPIPVPIPASLWPQAFTTPHHQMQVSTNADTVSVADIVYLGAQEGDSDGVTAPAASGTGVRIRIRTFQRPPAISHVVVGPWCTWPILSTAGDPYCASGFISVVGGEAVSPTAVSVGAVISPEQIAAVPEAEQLPIKQSTVDATGSSDQRTTDSHSQVGETECKKSVQKCTESNKKTSAKQGNKRKQKQKQRKQKREAEQKAATASATLAVPVSEDVAYQEQEKTDELQQDGDVTQTESLQKPEIGEEERKTEEIMYKPSSPSIETDKLPGNSSDTAVVVTDITNDTQQLNVNESVLTNKEVKPSGSYHDNGVVLVKFRQFKDEDSENADANKAENALESEELLIERSAATLPAVCETVCDPNIRKRKPKKRGRKNKGKPACDNSKQKGANTASTPAIISDIRQDLSHLPRERLSSCSSISSISDSDEGNNVDARLPIKRTYYFTSREDGDAISSDADVNINSNIERDGEEIVGKEDEVTNTSEEEEDEEMAKEEVEKAEKCQWVTLAARDCITPAVVDDEDNLQDDSSSRCSTDTEGGHPDGHHFSTVFVVNSSTDGEDSDAEDLPVCLTKIKILSEDDVVAVTEDLSVLEPAHSDTLAISCLDTPHNGSVVPVENEVAGVLLSHHVCQQEIPALSEQTVHESESVELKHVVETALDGDTEVEMTVPVDKLEESVSDNETSESVVNQEQNECRITFMNDAVPEQLITDMIAVNCEGDEQSLRSEVNEGRDELLSVVDSLAVQVLDKGCADHVTTMINESQHIEMIVSTENESDTEDIMNLLKHTDTECSNCNKPENEAVRSDSDVSETRSDNEFSNLPVIRAKSVTDNTLNTVECDAIYQLSAADCNQTADTGLVQPGSPMDYSEPFDHSSVELPHCASGHHSEDKQPTSGLYLSENIEVEEVEESVFVDEPFEGEEEEVEEGAEIDSGSVSESCTARESSEERVISTNTVAVSSEDTAACDVSGSSCKDAVSSEDEGFPISDSSTVSTEICPIDSVPAAASRFSLEEIVCENSPVLQPDETVAKITENIMPKVNVSETVCSEGSCGTSNKDNSHVLLSVDLMQETAESTSPGDSVMAETGDTAGWLFTDACEHDNDGNSDIVEKTAVSVGNATFKDIEHDVSVSQICRGETIGDITVSVDENIVPIDSCVDSAVGPIVDDVAVVEEEAKTEIRSSGDPVMLATVLQSTGSASVAGEDLLQCVPCSVVTESAKERDTFDSPSGEPRYTSLVMITQNHLHQESAVSVVTSETTTLVPADVIVRHTNWEEDGGDASPAGLAGYFTLTLETPGTSPSCKKPLITKTRPQVVKKEEATPVAQQEKEEQDLVKVVTGGDTLSAVVCLEEGLADDDSWVEELDNTGSNHEDDEFATTTPTDEDSDSGDEATLCSASAAASLSYSTDREEELRGYHRSAIDFTLHTIVEESCEESEVEQTPDEKGGKKQRPTSASELEKYFFYGLGGGTAMGLPPGGGAARELDSFSDTCSSIYSEGLECLGAEDLTTGGVGDGPAPGADDGVMDPAELASSRLEKYFLTGFMGFPASDRNSRDSDGSGSVGSDSEGRPSPEHRRKKLVRARGTGRQHSSSLDNLVSGELSGAEQQQSELQESEDSSSTETDTHHEDGGALSITSSGFEKPDGQFDTVKRKKKKRSVSSSAGGRVSPASLPSLDDKKECASAKSPVGDSAPDKTLASSEELSTLGVGHDDNSTTDDEEGCKTPQPEFLLLPASELSASRNKQQSRDSGFIGSCDDLLKEQRASSDSSTSSNNNDIPAALTLKAKQATMTSVTGELKRRDTVDPTAVDSGSTLPVVEEGVGDSSKVAHVIATSSIPPATSLTRKDSFNNWSSDEETNLMMSKMRAFFKTMVAASSSSQGQQKTPHASPSTRQRATKPPQLVYFENELTRLMKTVPGIKDEQVREIVEYLSSEDTWSDSYDSSDYTSSDLEGAYYMHQQGKVGAAVVGGKSELQEQISVSCQQIISKFDTSLDDEEENNEDKGCGLNRDTAFVYQRLVASFNKMAGDQQNGGSSSGQKGSHSASSDSTPYSSPPLIAKVMHHIGSRLVALMHEVSGGEGLGATTSSPKVRYHHHRRLQAKLSAASTTTDDDSHTDTEQSGVELPGLPRSKSHDLLLERGTRPNGVSSSMELATSEERETSDYERFSWRGSFESALMAADSRTKLSLLQDSNNASSTTALAAKRRSAGDLLFAGKSSSREQLLDRVRSCGSIGGSVEDKIWNARRRRSSVPDANTCHAGSGTSADGDDDDDTDDDDDDSDMRSTTLPRSLQTSCSAGTNSLPRLPTSATPSPAPSVLSTASSGGMYKSHSVQHFGQGHVKSARYRPPGFSRLAAPKRAVSAPGLQPLHPSRNNREAGRRNRLQCSTAAPSPQISGETSASEDVPSIVLPSHNKNAGLSTLVGAGVRKISAEWPTSTEEDIDRLVALHLQQTGLSTSLGPRSDSMASVYSGAGEGHYGTVAVKGEVEFGLEYNYKASTLEIHVKQCRDLAPVDSKRNRSDPYVKVYLLPDKSKSGKRKTKVKKHTLNPIFDETLKFQISLDELETRTLWLTVWHSDMFGRNDFLGEVMMALESKVFDDPSPHWYLLHERTEQFDDLLSYKGEVIIGLKFVPPDVTSAVHKKGKRSSRGSLNVLVKGAKNLTAVKANGTSDPFCKSYLLPDKGRSSKQKTPVLRRTCSPTWNYTFIYEDVSLQELSERSLELTVWDHDRLSSNEFLGGLRFNLGSGKHYGKAVDWMDATGEEIMLWKCMLERPGLWVEGCLTLRPSLEHQNS